MSKRLKIQVVVYALLFSIASMGVMLVHAQNKVIVVTDIAQDQISRQEEENGTITVLFEKEEGKVLHFRDGEARTNCLCIPLVEGIKAENVTIENHYMDKELWIYIEKCDENFYETQAIYGNIEKVNFGTYSASQKGVLLKFGLTDVFECQSTLQENGLFIEFVSPKEMYNKIIVIDPACGGENLGLESGDLQEKEITLDIVKRLKEKLDDTDIKVYYTRIEDKNPSQEERIELANSVKADMFISIAANWDAENDKKYGTEAVYSDSFFIPVFGSVELADLTLREVVTKISGKGNGLIPATVDDVVVWEAKVPATILKVGYFSNKQEVVLLQREDYLERIASGLLEAVQKAYESE